MRFYSKIFIPHKGIVSSNPASSIMDDAGSGSLFIVTRYWGMNPPHYSILQLDRERATVHEMVRFNQPEELSEMPWWFSPLNSSKEDLYMVPGLDLGGRRVKKSLHGFKFNFRTGKLQAIKHLRTGKLQAIKHLGSMDRERYVVNLRGDICFIAPYEYDGCVFVRYDPDKESWNGRNPVGDFLPHIPVKVVAIAVWEDTILLNKHIQAMVSITVCFSSVTPGHLDVFWYSNSSRGRLILVNFGVHVNGLYGWKMEGCCKNQRPDDKGVSLSYKDPFELIKMESAMHLLKGQSILNHISIAMDNTEVVNFVKYYDKLMKGETLRRFVIFKMYTADEMKQFYDNKSEPTETTEASHSLASAGLSEASLLWMMNTVESIKKTKSKKRNGILQIIFFKKSAIFRTHQNLQHP